MTSPAVDNYAKAIVGLMKEQGLLDLTHDIAEALIGQFKNRELTLLLSHPQVPTGGKKALLEKMVLPGTPQEFLNFLNLIIDRGWQSSLPKIMSRVVQLSILEQGYEQVTLISAQPLTVEEQNAIQRRLEALWQIKIYPELRVNPNLLGGIIIQRGDKLYDGSLSGQLNKIKEILINQEATGFD